jgi:hypothetical protein
VGVRWDGLRSNTRWNGAETSAGGRCSITCSGRTLFPADLTARVLEPPNKRFRRSRLLRRLFQICRTDICAHGAGYPPHRMSAAAE